MAIDIGAVFDLPFDQAVAFLRGKARVPTDHWTGVWRQAHARGFMVAGATSEALLQDFQDEMIRAHEQGGTLKEFQEAFPETAAKHGWSYNGTPGWRSRVIFETNMVSAQAAGRYAQMTEPGTLKAFPFWRYVHSGAAHPRPQHLAWNGMVLRAGDPWWHTHYAPNGWGCHCRVEPVSRRDLARMGKDGPDTAPPVEYDDWTNPRTGETHRVPKGIDPGFDYNVGEAWLGPPPKTIGGPSASGS